MSIKLKSSEQDIFVWALLTGWIQYKKKRIVNRMSEDGLGLIYTAVTIHIIDIFTTK